MWPVGVGSITILPTKQSSRTVLIRANAIAVPNLLSTFRCELQRVTGEMHSLAGGEAGLFTTLDVLDWWGLHRGH